MNQSFLSIAKTVLWFKNLNLKIGLHEMVRFVSKKNNNKGFWP